MYSLKDFKFQSIGRSEEQIIKVLHRNWLDIASQYIVVVLAGAIFFASILVYPWIFPQLDDINYRILFLFVENIFLLAIWIYCFLIWVDYYLDIWIITTERIINIEQRGLFMRRVSTAEYEKIQDITVEVKGFLQTIINYGDVRIQTAGELENIIFRKVSDPYHLKNLLVKMQKDKERQETKAFGEIIRGRNEIKIIADNT